MANEQQRYDMSEKIWTVLEPYLAGRHGPWDRIAAVPLSARARRAPDQAERADRERRTGGKGRPAGRPYVMRVKEISVRLETLAGGPVGPTQAGGLAGGHDCGTDGKAGVRNGC